MKPILTAVLSVLLLSGCASVEKKEAKEAARKKAELWFYFLDEAQGNYLWDVTAEVIKMRENKEPFIKYYLGKRDPLGKVISRKLQYNWKIDAYHLNLPDGTYRSLVYWTEYENKKRAEESLLLTLQEDGQWKVIQWRLR